MKITKIILLILLFKVSLSNAQNLISNSGFETCTTAPAAPGEWYKCSGWSDVNNYPAFAWPYASPDYLSTLGTGSAHLPASIFGVVTPYAGNAVMGLVPYYAPNSADYREYISVHLSTPMNIGQQYTISFMMSNGESGQYCGSGCSNIGVCFSVTPLTQINHEPIAANPQFEMTSVWWSTSWQLVTFTITPTQDFQYFTLGNFKNDANTQHTVFVPGATAPNGAYYFIDQTVVAPTTPLPVCLLNFNADKKGTTNELNWSTASEVNCDYFSVERSSDGNNFESIGTQQGAGNSNAITCYKFVDDFPLKQINYYRLKQFDFNGDFTYSKIIFVNNGSIETTCTVYTLDALGSYTLECEAIKNGTVCIFNLDGKLLNENAFNSKSIPINLLSYSPGVYLIQISDGEKFVTTKLTRK